MKHIKNTVSDLKDLFEHRITADSIAEEFVAFDRAMPADEARSRLEDLGFDIVGVMTDGRCTGYVDRHELGSGLLGDYQRSLDALSVVGHDTSLRTTVEKVFADGRVLMHTPDEALGIVTRGDMNKAPVRMWIFALVTLLEMQMLRVIRCLPNPEEFCKKALSLGRLSKAHEIQAERMKNHSDADLLDCLQFADKRTLIDKIRKDSKISASIGIDVDRNLVTQLKVLERLRNEVAHGNDILLMPIESSLSECAGYAERILEQLERVRKIA